jgi:hypothetical protein
MRPLSTSPPRPHVTARVPHALSAAEPRATRRVYAADDEYAANDVYAAIMYTQLMCTRSSCVHAAETGGARSHEPLSASQSRHARLRVRVTRLRGTLPRPAHARRRRGAADMRGRDACPSSADDERQRGERGEGRKERKDRKERMQTGKAAKGEEAEEAEPRCISVRDRGAQRGPQRGPQGQRPAARPAASLRRAWDRGGSTRCRERRHKGCWLRARGGA